MTPRDRADSGWISVDERLPEEGVIVIAHVKNRGSTLAFCNTYSDEKRHWVSVEKDWGFLKPTHWCLLPDPPEEIS